jgi:hypothetical protein
MTLQISQRGNEYLRAAQTLLRTAKTMADQAIAGQLKAAEDYERRAEKGFAMMQPKHWPDRLLKRAGINFARSLRFRSSWRIPVA